MTSAPQPTTASRFAVFSGDAAVVAHTTPAWHGAAGEPQTGYHIFLLKHRAGTTSMSGLEHGAFALVAAEDILRPCDVRCTICSRSSVEERALYKGRGAGSSPAASTTIQNEKLNQQPCLRVAPAKQEDVGQSRSGHTQRRHQSQPTPAAREHALCVDFADSPHFVTANNCTRTSSAVGSESRLECGQFPPVLALATSRIRFDTGNAGCSARRARVNARTQCVGHISCCHAPFGRRTLAAGGFNLVLSITAQACAQGTVEAGSQTSRPRHGRPINMNDRASITSLAPRFITKSMKTSGALRSLSFCDVAGAKTGKFTHSQRGPHQHTWIPGWDIEVCTKCGMTRDKS